MVNRYRIVLALGCTAAMLAVASSNALADVKIGTSISISIQSGEGGENGVGYVVPIEGYDVFKDDQNSYYIKGEDSEIKPPRGDDITYKDAEGKTITIIQGEGNLDKTTGSVHNYKDSLLTSLMPVSANPGDFLWPLMIPESLKDEYLSLTPPGLWRQPSI